MLGRRNRAQMELFVTGSLERLIPEDHILARVNRVLDLNCLREEVSDCYCADNGRPGIDPEVAVRLMLAGLLLGFVHDRRLMREAQVNLAIRWFIGYGLEDELPDHSSLTRIRQRWGEARFREIFRRTVRACLDAKVAKGEVVHVDASLIRANASWESLVERHVDEVMAEHPVEEEKAAKEDGGGRGGGSGKVSRTDPDARLSRTGGGFEPSYKQHAVVDDARGVVLDVSVTEGTVNEREVLESQVEAVRELWGRDPALVTADCGLRLLEGLRGPGAPGCGRAHPGEERTHAEPCSVAAVPLRRAARHREVSTGQDAESPPARKGRALLSFEDA